MKDPSLVIAVSLLLVAGVAAADRPYTHYSEAAPGSQATDQPMGANQPGGVRALTFYNDRATFSAAFPGLPTEAWSNTLVAPGAIVGCDGPFNSTTNNACFAPGGILPGIEIACVQSPALVVIGTGALGNANVLVGPNTFAEDMVLNFNPAVRAAGLDVVNPLNPGQSYTVEVFGPAGSLGTTTVVDGGEGTFWGVDSDDVGGITSIVFNGGGIGNNSELSALVTFGGTPVPVELQGFDVE